VKPRTKSNDRVRILCGCLLLLIATAERIEAAEVPVRTNLQQIVQVTQDVVEAALGELTSEELVDHLRISGATLSASVPYEANWIAEAVLTDALVAFGIPVRTRVDLSGSGLPDRLLEYRILEIGTEFTGQQRRRWLIGEKVVDRLVRVKLSIQFTDSPSGEVLWRQERSLEVADRFPKRALQKVQSNRYSFAASALQESDISRIVEPVIVSGVVGWLTYLFFSNR